MLRKGRWLVVAPHADDEVLGLGPLLYQADEIHALILELRPKQFPEDAEAKVGRILSADTARYIQGGAKDIRHTMNIIEGGVYGRGYSAVFTPTSDSVHQSHRFAYEATMAALRPARIGRSVTVYSYRVLSDCPPRMGNVVVEVSPADVMNAAKAFDDVYADQARPGRNGEAIMRWAAACGDWIGKPYAWSLDLVQATEYAT